MQLETLANKNILIVGLGMIGGSIARRLHSLGSSIELSAWDGNTDSLSLALDEGVIGSTGTLGDLCQVADIVILALPTLAIEQVLPKIACCLKPGACVTDVGSVKGNIIAQATSLNDSFLKVFVPGHPIAGSERSGYSAAKADLFDNRNVILTPLPSNTASAVNLINLLWRSLGAQVLAMPAENHDRVLAATSHLPHLLAYAIVDVLVNREDSKEIFKYAAGGFADFSRLASSDATMWADIFIANSRSTEQVLDAYIDNLHSLKAALVARDRDHFLQVFNRAKQARDRFVRQYFEPTTYTSDEQVKSVDYVIQPADKLTGSIRVPGDKSISHRSIIFGAIAEGVTEISGFLEGEDALNTLAAFREMGVTIVGPDNGKLTIWGVGKYGLQPPNKPLYMGNSGTAMRLLAGLLAAQPFESELTGDHSLSGRPMGRIITPLREMGAQIESSNDNSRAQTPPLLIKGSSLHGINYLLPMASAQVKSCLLLAGMYAEGTTQITEPAPCRDHTERMLKGFGYDVTRDLDTGVSSLNGEGMLRATKVEVPADISSAAFLLVAASIVPGSNLLLEHVGVNPTRTGVITILRLMGADIELLDEREVSGERVANIQVRYSALQGIEIPQEQIPLAIDEFPVLFIAAACAVGETVLRGAEELRVKESDRISAMAQGLLQLGIDVEVYDDGIRIVGGTLGQGTVESLDDHRIAMAFAVAGLRGSGPITVRNCANVATSFPGFVDLMKSLGADMTQMDHG